MSKRKNSKSTKVVLRGDIVKDDSGNCNVFAEARCLQRHIMMAVGVFDVISRLPTCFGQTCDAVSGYTQVDYRKRTVQRFGSGYRNQEDHNIGTQLTIQ